MFNNFTLCTALLCSTLFLGLNPTAQAFEDDWLREAFGDSRKERSRPRTSRPRRKRSSWKTVKYSRGRTYHGSYQRDPNRYKTSRCQLQNRYDFNISDYSQRFLQAPFKDPRLDDFDIIVKVSIKEQRLFVFSREKYKQSGGRNGLLYAFTTSSGAHDWEPRKRIWDKVKDERGRIVRKVFVDKFKTSRGFHIINPIAFSSRHISGEAIDAPMPWALFFNRYRGQATHGTPFRGTLGRPASHGCLRLKEEHACTLFHTVGKTPIADVSLLTRKTGTPTGRTIKGHKAIFIIY